MGLNTENLKLTATIVADGKTLDSTGKANEDGWYYPEFQIQIIIK